MISPRVIAFAKRIWVEKQATYPAFTRRLVPDALDHATGAWSIVLAEAERRLNADPHADAEHRSSRDLFDD